MTTSTRMDDRLIDVPHGLANVVVTETELSDVRGNEGFYHYRQYDATDLAASRSVEEVWSLLLDGSLPTPEAASAFTVEVANHRALSPALNRILPSLVASTADGSRPSPMSALRAAIAIEGSQRGLRPLYDLSEEERRRDLIGLAAAVPTMIAALSRLSRGLEPVDPDPALGLVDDYLRMIRGDQAPQELADALSVYLVAAIDHGFNASTFTARVIASTGADAAACIVGALGSLSGPLHGGAPSRALDTLDAIGDPSRTDAWITEQLTAGRRIMGFGHPVYRTEDPRSALLKRVAQRFGGPRVELAVQVEERIPALLEQYKPGRALHTNLEWYAGVVMEIVGLDRDLFTPTFAAARVLGWTANVLEQARDPKIIRPRARYVGPAPESAGVAVPRSGL